MHTFKIKRIYEQADSSDGIRVLVDRIWPRGMSKENAHLTAWMKDIAPSAELRKWFNHIPAKFPEFQRRYEAELTSAALRDDIRQLISWVRESDVTLLYASKDEQYNQAVVLQRFLTDRMGMMN
ncbi:DUF488 family protein [Paenibacillus melissococcoides]|uniref:DUF488 family protein n=1 Tax=Paenibacillus melissococcoides TaxID=2912268 RepID=A0ABM9G300_9BACL|nr:MULTISPECIES: DUF488 family protein [Paenibacillus]MEB9892254.1 DUF488 family protein [Bacillus cereus]CAH8245906.1 DUF488 family protein [Paenibacillus melissococcoides]CAH8712426.1 DUF488 family protein [Paenibacillus melissococcoides]CAH8713172.1 DUF488 family protein [Paenibacillus melissococcoides]GIO77531.1 hypothetical protein J6TS7_11410 [Paenibacillus dendritiformis]